MVLPSDRERIKTLLIETITLLCKNGLNFQFEFSVEALIGITIDQSDVFLINIQETVKSGQGNEEGECQGEAQNDSSTEQFSDTSLPPSIQNADYQQTVVSLQSLSRRNVITDMLSAEGNTDAFGKLQAVSGASRRKSKMNAVSKNYHHVLSPSKSEGCLPEIPLSSPSAGDDVICDLENVFPNVPSQKNSEISTESLTFTNQEPPRKRRCGVSPSSRVAEDGHGSRETNIEDLITQCKTEPLDLIKLEESPIDSSAVESPNRQENSSFLYNSTYSNDISYTNWYGQENLVNPSAIPGCSTWPNPSTHNASAKHLPDQAASGWNKNPDEVPPSLFGPVSWKKTTGEALMRSHTTTATPWSASLQMKKSPFSCTLCDKKVKLLRDLRAHMATKHNLEKDYACTICGSRFTYKHNLLCHMRTVHGMK